jgi:hypothetical protein
MYYDVMASVRKGVSPMHQESDRPTHSWDGIAREIMQETDPNKLHMLAIKLNDAMLTEERDE